MTPTRICSERLNDKEEEVQLKCWGFFKQGFAAKYSSWEQQQQKPHSFCLCDKYKLEIFFSFRELSQDKQLPLMSAAKSLSHFTFW